jgi:hypothetical protein
LKGSMRACVNRAYARAGRYGIMLPYALNALAARGDREDCRLPGKRGSGQYVHPDLISQDGKLFLAATAYPFGVECYEEPEVFGSTDGEEWEALFCVSLPPRDRSAWHLSDPDLLAWKGRIYLYYRKCLRRPHLGNEEILVAETNSGNRGSVVLSEPKLTLLSPAAIPLSGGMVGLFCVDAAAGGKGCLRRYLSDDPLRLETFEYSEIPDINIWHCDLAWVSRKLIGLFITQDVVSPERTSLLLCESEDEGLSFQALGEIKLPGRGIRRIYRSSLCDCGDHSLLAASFETEDSKWHTRIYSVRLANDGLAFLG